MEKLPQKKYRATVVRSESVAKGVKKISFTVDGVFTFLPQQYVWVEIADVGGLDRRSDRRAFSVANSPNTENAVEILSRISDSAFKQRLFALKTGDPVYIHGPFGTPFVLTETHHPENIILIAGGTGISAFLGLLDALKTSPYPVRCFLVYLNTNSESTPFMRELHAFMKQNAFFDYKVQFEIFSWNDVAEVVKGMAGTIEWHVLGPRPMVEHVYRTLEEGGVSRFDVVFQEFYPTPANTLTREAIQQQLPERNVFTNALQQSPNHSIITDVNGVILFANKAAQTITGYAEDEILGNTPRLWGGMMEQSFYKDFWGRKGSGKPFASEITNRRKSGEIYYASVYISAIFGEAGEIIGYIGTEVDITSVKEREARLHASEDRLAFALKGSRDGLWDWDISENTIFFSSRWKEMLGFTDEEFHEDFQAWRKRIHPEDAGQAETQLQRHLDGDAPFYEGRYRILCKDGTYRWVLDRATVVARDGVGKATRVVGTQSDITEMMLREDELERTNRVMVDRELKMIELKKEIARLKGK